MTRLKLDFLAVSAFSAWYPDKPAKLRASLLRLLRCHYPAHRCGARKPDFLRSATNSRYFFSIFPEKIAG